MMLIKITNNKDIKENQGVGNNKAIEETQFFVNNKAIEDNIDNNKASKQNQKKRQFVHNCHNYNMPMTKRSRHGMVP